MRALNRLIDHFLRCFGGIQFGHGRFAGHPAALGVLGPGGPIDEQRRCVDFQLRIGQFFLNKLIVGNRFSERYAAFRLRHRLVMAATGKTQCCGAYR